MEADKQKSLITVFNEMMFYLNASYLKHPQSSLLLFHIIHAAVYPHVAFDQPSSIMLYLLSINQVSVLSSMKAFVPSLIEDIIFPRHRIRDLFVS